MGTVARISTEESTDSEVVMNWVDINSLFNLMGVATPSNVVFSVAIDKSNGGKVLFPTANIKPPVSKSGDGIGFGFSTVVEDSNEVSSTITGLTFL